MALFLNKNVEDDLTASRAGQADYVGVWRYHERW